jgi:hypothetical protein
VDSAGTKFAKRYSAHAIPESAGRLRPDADEDDLFYFEMVAAPSKPHGNTSPLQQRGFETRSTRAPAAPPAAASPVLAAKLDFARRAGRLLV